MLGCAPQIDSPYTDDPRTSIRDYNLKNILKLDPNKPLRFAIISDSHQNYADLGSTIKIINEKNVSFVLNTGDFTNIGSNTEYDQFIEQVQSLTPPIISTIGNHDTVGKGVDLFRKIFGPDNYFFDHQSFRFIIFNNNYLDMGSIDLPWLDSAINTSPFPVIIMQHIPVSEADYFPGEIKGQVDISYQNPKIFLVLNGHKHGFDDQMTYHYLTHQTARTEGSQYSILTISEGSIYVENCVASNCSSAQY